MQQTHRVLRSNKARLLDTEERDRLRSNKDTLVLWQKTDLDIAEKKSSTLEHRDEQKG